MMMSSNGNIFRVTGPLCGEFSDGEFTDRSLVNSPHKGQWCGALIFALICTPTNDWVNNREAGDLRYHHAHYDVTVMSIILKVYLFKTLLRTYILSTSYDITHDKTTLSQVLAWHHYAASHSFNLCWPTTVSPYGIHRPQWVKKNYIWSTIYFLKSLMTKKITIKHV